MTFSALGKVAPVWAAAMHTVGSLMVVFNSARLVRKGEELEHYHPERRSGEYTSATTPRQAPELAAA